MQNPTAQIAKRVRERGLGHNTRNSVPNTLIKKEPVTQEHLHTREMAQGTDAAVETALCLEEA